MTVIDETATDAASAGAVALTRPARARARTSSPARVLGAQLLVLAATAALWWLFAEVVFAANPVVSKMGPLDAASGLVTQLGEPAFLDAIAVSLGRLLAGLGIATVIGIPLGVLFGSRALVESATNPVVQLLRMTSPLAWAPLALVLLGAGSGAVIALVALAALWPIVLGVSAGVRALDPGHARMARSLGATRVEVFRSTALPALATPLTGALRVALGISWIVLVPAEMLGVANGLGYAILNARDNVDYGALAATMLAIGILGFLLDRIFRGIHRLSSPRSTSSRP